MQPYNTTLVNSIYIILIVNYCSPNIKPFLKGQTISGIMNGDIVSRMSENPSSINVEKALDYHDE